MRRFLCVIFLALAVGAAAAQDPATVSPGTFQVEIENQWVRVLRMNQAPHAKVSMHSFPASVVIFLTDADQEFIGVDGSRQEIVHMANDVVYTDATRRAEESLSDAPIKAVAVELKPGASRDGVVPAALDPMNVDPQHHSVLFENDRVRVLRTVLEPHLRGPMHAHPHYVVVYLTILHTTMTMPDGRKVDNPRQPGDIAWRDPLQHITENIGEKTAVEIQIELK